MRPRVHRIGRAVLLTVGLTLAGAQGASAAQAVSPLISDVEADKAPVLAGTGRAWDGPAVAVVDSGVEAHNDLRIAGNVDCTGIGTATDQNGHGTGVAGTIAALDNSSGVLGVAPGAPLYNVRVLDAKEKGTLSTLHCGMQWVIDHHAQDDIRVVNLSLGFPGSDDGNCGRSDADQLHRDICTLTAAGVVVVASGGNQTADLNALVPASYNEVLTATNMANYDGKPGALAASPCGAATRDDMYATTSNWASGSDVDHTVAAPGVCPFTLKKGNRSGYVQQGTSMSAAAVSGVVLDCLRPGGACGGRTVPQIISTIRAQAQAAAARGRTFSGDPTKPVAGRYYGYAVSTAPTNAPPPPPTGPGDTTPPRVAMTAPANGASVRGSVTLVATASDDVGVGAVRFSSGSTALGNGARSGTSDQWTLMISSRSFPNGTYPITARAVDAAGNQTVSPPISLVVAN